MKKLVISPSLSLPAEAMTLTSAVLGIRGSGKTNTAVIFTEELLAQRQQVIVVDPLDVWWGLKSNDKGDTAGFPIVVLGGVHGDLPLSADDGATIADFLTETRSPAILSLRHLRKGEQRRFVADFAEQLYQRKGESGHNTPVLVVFDEASSFVPQSVQGDVARMVGAVEDLVRRGRAAGIGVMLIDQRAASVNKDVLTQLELLVAHRHTSPQDRAALKLWVQAHDTGEMEKTFLDSLASLPLGEAWFWSPGWLDVFKRVKVRKRSTFDSSATPQLGQTPATPATQATVDLDALRDRLAATVERAANSDPKYLQKRIDELTNQIKAQKPQVIETRIEVPVLGDGQVRQLQETAENLQVLAKELLNVAGEITREIHSLTAVTARGKHAIEATQVLAAPIESAPKQTTSASTVTNPQQRILNALASFERLGLKSVSKSNVAVFADQSPRSSGFTNNLGTLRTQGFITYPAPGIVALSEAGRQHAYAPLTPATLQELHQAWFAKLSRPQTAIISELIEGYPGAFRKDDLAKRAGQSPTSSGYTNNLGSLRSLGLLDYPQPGHVVATALLFPNGLK